MDEREVLLYTRSRSLRCWRAKRLLARRGYHFEVVETTNDGLRGLLKQLTSSNYRRTVPHLGKLNRQGTFEDAERPWVLPKYCVRHIHANQICRQAYTNIPHLAYFAELRYQLKFSGWSVAVLAIRTYLLHMHYLVANLFA